jgi:hypothetical protein
MAAGNGEAQALALGKEPMQGLFLCDLEGKGIPFYSLFELRRRRTASLEFLRL